ncbi:tyrosine-type recombinase/integrase [Oscillospiraceae bacterium 50-60]
MRNRKLKAEMVAAYDRYLCLEERAPGTREKYLRDIRQFAAWLDGRTVTKELAVAWKEYLLSQQYALSTINGVLAALNGLFCFFGWNECRVKPLKRQRSVFRSGERELTRGEYLRLLDTAKREGNERLYLVMETLCSTGMRVSELRFITAETLERGFAMVDCKGKQRTVLLTKRLRRTLIAYCRRRGIRNGAVFVTRNGRPLDRSNIWRDMRSLCDRAGVEASKVFPHNLRHLFAVSFYNVEKDIAKLADLLGHASIETTRIYIMESSAAHAQRLEQLGLVI